MVYRPDIDGLRALAIIAVVVFHAFPNYLMGGFVGVDIFFVISGYLITSIILKAQRGPGFSLLEFYGRRIKRIFPALILVLAFCLLVGWYVLLADEYELLGLHVAAGSIFTSNFILLSEKGYFDTASELKPLLHLWSLGIEEQFYLLWPLFLILASRWKANLLLLIIVALLFSFALNVININNRPNQVFFNPLFRSWELLIGAVLAYINLYKHKIFDRFGSLVLFRDPTRTQDQLANITAWVGIVLITFAVFGLNKDKQYPGYWALLPTMGTFCLIAAGERAWFSKHILSNNILVYVGIISYPLYLWHWILLSFLFILNGSETDPWLRLCVVIVSVILAWATFWFVERRIKLVKSVVAVTSLLFVMIITGAVGFHVYLQNGYPHRYPKEEVIARNLGSVVWGEEGWNHQASCIERFGREFQQYCELYDSDKMPTVLLIGDSNANHFYPGLANMYATEGDNLLNLGQGGCTPFFGVNVQLDKVNLHCEKTIDKALTLAIQSKEIKTVVLSMMGSNFEIESGVLNGYKRISYPREPGLEKPLLILEDAMRATLRKLIESGKHVVYINGVPKLNFDPAMCVNYRPWQIGLAAIKEPCAMSRKVYESEIAEYRGVVLRVLQDFPQVKLWDSSRELCDRESCWAMKEGVMLYRDAYHLSVIGSDFMSKKFQGQ